MTAIKQTFCRICSPQCPLLAELDDNGNLVKLRPDASHPVSKGYACHKGMSFSQVNQDPDRLNEPLQRLNSRKDYPGEFKSVSWDEALGDIGAKLKGIQNEYGSDAVAVYKGNPVVLNSRAFPMAYSIQDTIGTKYSFGANTQDLANKFAAFMHVFGSFEFTVPDLHNTDFLIYFGGNPKISRGTIYFTPNPMEAMKDINRRGGRVLFINPRKIESSNKDTGKVMQVKPDSDTYLMASLLCELDKLGAYNEQVVREQSKHIEGLRAFVAKYPAERVADVVGVSADEIVQLAKDIAAAKSVAFHMGTGVNQGRQGTLAFWLLNMLIFVTGNFSSVGGNYKPLGSFASGEPELPRPPVDTPVGSFSPVWGDLPGNILADLINSEERPIRALINLSGNPLITMSGEDKLREAFSKLDLIVSIDICRSDTCELSDYILPATDWLEREDINFFSMGSQLKPYLQYADAVVEPAGQRKNDWWIISKLLQAMGRPSVLDDPATKGWSLIEVGLQSKDLSIEDIKAAPNNTVVLPEVDEYATTYERVVLHPDKKVDCCPQAFDDALETCEEIFGQLASENGGELKIISLRTNYMHNSWLTNMPLMRKGRHAENPINIHPEDAAKRGLVNGQDVTVFNDHGEVETQILLNRDLRPGVVAMTHGYGHRFAPSLSLASEIPGGNVNRLLPTGSGSYESLSGMSWMNGVAVEVRARA